MRDTILEVVANVMTQLPPDIATATQELGSLEEGITVTLRPRLRNASPIIISSGPHAQSVFVEMGEATTVELTGRDAGLLERELLDVLTAITKKGFVERTWRHEGTVIQSEANLPLGSGRSGQVSSQFGRRGLLAVSDVFERRFLPYE